MFTAFVTSKLKTIVFILINAVRRALCCCWRRRSKQMNEDEENNATLTHIVSVREETNEVAANVEEEWNDWEFKNRKPQNVKEHIEYYRQQQAKQQTIDDEKKEFHETNDLFVDMTPKITKQMKLLVAGGGENKRQTNDMYRFDVQHDDDDSMHFIGNELVDWDEDSGWDKANLDWDAQQLLKMKKREERRRFNEEQLQKRKEGEKKSSRPLLGAKLPT